MLKELSIIFLGLIVTLFACCYANVAGAQIVEDGLLSYWACDQKSINGGIITDEFAGQEGLIVGDPVVVGGKVGQALEFSGDDYIEIPDQTAGKETVTVTLWVKLTDDSSDRTIFGYWPDAATSVFLLYYDVGDHIWRFIVREAGGAAKDIKVSDPSVDSWTHLAASYEKGGEISLYVDTEKNSNDANDQALNAVEIPWMGIGWDMSHPNLIGLIDEICFYDCVLTSEEVGKNFKAMKGLAVSDQGKLTAIWGEVKTSF
jgi:hypothetical protein